MGRPTERKTSKIAHQIFKKKNAFSNLCPLLPTTWDTSEKFYMGAQLHSFRYAEA